MGTVGTSDSLDVLVSPLHRPTDYSASRLVRALRSIAPPINLTFPPSVALAPFVPHRERDSNTAKTYGPLNTRAANTNEREFSKNFIMRRATILVKA